MANTDQVTNRIKNRKPVFDVNINSKIRAHQRTLVKLSFEKRNNTIAYFKTLEKIRELRKHIFKGALT